MNGSRPAPSPPIRRHGFNPTSLLSVFLTIGICIVIAIAAIAQRFA